MATEFLKLWRLILVSLLLVANIFVWYQVAGADDGSLVVYFLDVGQGDAIFIDSPVGHQVLIDGGPNRAVLRELGQVLPFYDRTIDLVIATHPDSDHIGGLPEVLERYSVAGYLESGVKSDSAIFSSLEESLSREEGIRRMTARRGQVIDLGGGAFLTVLFPDRDVSAGDPNDGSVIVKLSYGETDFLLTGDASMSVERYLLSLDAKFLDVEVLKLGHHGSKTSTAPEFLDAATPDYAVVSVGRNNRYGHPSSEVIEALEERGIEILRTDQVGRVTIETDGRSLVSKGLTSLNNRYIIKTD